MNLEQVMSQTELRTPVRMLKPQTRSAIQVAKRVFQLAANGGFPYKHQTPESWAKKWLKSEEFKLMEIDIAAAAALNINAAASPHMPKNPNRVAHYIHCSVESLDPVVVDVNCRGVGKTYLGYVPPVIVLDGKHRKMAQIQNGRTRILAWVGCRAIKRMPVETLHEVDESNSAIMTKIASFSKEVYLPPVDGTRIAAAYEIHASTVPSVGIGIPRQDSGEGGSRPKDSMHSGGPGSGRHAAALKQAGYSGKFERYNGPNRMYSYSHSDGSTYKVNKSTDDSGKPTGVKSWSYRGPKGSTSGSDESSLVSHVGGTGRQGISKYEKMDALGGTGANGMGGPGASNQGGANVVNAGGPGSGRRPGGGQGKPDQSKQRKLTALRNKYFKLAQVLGPSDLREMRNQINKAAKSLKAGEVGDCNACGARGSGTIEDDTSNNDKKIPPDSSDAGTFVDSSDQLKWNPKKANNYAPGTKPGYTDQFGSPNFQAPGSGVGQRILNKGASNSDMNRALTAGGPGSGRRPGVVAKEFGYKRVHAPSRAITSKPSYNLYKHPDGHSLMIKPDGRWMHKDSGLSSGDKGKQQGGSGGRQLGQYLYESVHYRDKMQAGGPGSGRKSNGETKYPTGAGGAQPGKYPSGWGKSDKAADSINWPKEMTDKDLSGLRAGKRIPKIFNKLKKGKR
jgi:hypothetical protein